MWQIMQDTEWGSNAGVVPGNWCSGAAELLVSWNRMVAVKREGTRKMMDYVLEVKEQIEGI